MFAEEDWWFYTVNGGDLKRINVARFYHFGGSMQRLREMDLHGDDNAQTRHLVLGEWGLQSFLRESEGMSFPLSRIEAQNVLEAIKKITDRRTEEHIVDFQDIRSLNQSVKDFQMVFNREAGRASAYSITPKGIYDTEKLLEEGEKKFPPELLAVMPAQVVDDIREASRCLAFERGTACAFHICRATEGLMRAYYKKLTGDDWPPPPPKPKMNRDWYTLVSQLKVEGAPKKIIERLGELREDRNSYAHPDVTVPIDEAPIVYETCTFAMFYIAKEMT